MLRSKRPAVIGIQGTWGLGIDKRQRKKEEPGLHEWGAGLLLGNCFIDHVEGRFGTMKRCNLPRPITVLCQKKAAGVSLLGAPVRRITPRLQEARQRERQGGSKAQHD